MIWFSILIPFILAGALLGIPYLRVRTKWWELAIPIVLTVITIVICQMIAVNSAISDKEYWGHIAYKAIHEEPFSYDSECSETYACGTDSKGNTRYCTRYVHCVEYSSRKCYMIDDRNQKYHLSYGYYKKLTKRWKNNGYDNKIIVTRSHGYTTKGDKYKRPNHGKRHWVYWPKNNWNVAEPIVVEHTYENRLQTQSHWGKVSEKDRIAHDVFDYPSVPGGWLLTSILTNGPRYPKSDKYLRYLNAYLNTNKGGYKKVRMWLLIYKNKSQESAELQRSYWKNGNKNEIVTMIGINDDDQIVWADVMSQVDDTGSLALMTEIRDKLLIEMSDAKLTDVTLNKFIKWKGSAVQSSYTKPDFKQYKYIQVQPSLFALIISYIIIIVVNIGAGVFVVLNPWDDRNKFRYR